MEIEQTTPNQTSRFYQFFDWILPTFTDFIHNVYDQPPKTTRKNKQKLNVLKRKRGEDTATLNFDFSKNQPHFTPDILNLIMSHLSDSPWSIKNLYLTIKIFHVPILSMIETMKINRFTFETKWVNFDHCKDEFGRVYKFRSRLELKQKRDFVKIGDLAKGNKGLC